MSSSCKNDFDFVPRLALCKNVIPDSFVKKRKEKKTVLVTLAFNKLVLSKSFLLEENREALNNGF